MRSSRYWTRAAITVTLAGEVCGDNHARHYPQGRQGQRCRGDSYENPADDGGGNVYDITIAFSDGTNDLAAQTTAITVTDANDQTPAVTVAATYTQAEAAATTFQDFTMVDTDTSGPYACTLGGDDSAAFATSVSGQVCTVTFAANPDSDTPADDDLSPIHL